MKFRSTPVGGAFLIELEPNTDARGSFSRSFCKREFAENDIAFDIVQSNLAHTRHAGIVRGLHYQEHPRQERKLVRCIAGAVFDVIVDMRRDSATYLATYQVRLDPENQHSLFIPAGVAHGYQALERDTVFMYMTDEYYSPGLEKGVRYDDPALAIAWPLPPRDITERDRAWPSIRTVDGDSS